MSDALPIDFTVWILVAMAGMNAFVAFRQRGSSAGGYLLLLGCVIGLALTSLYNENHRQLLLSAAIFVFVCVVWLPSLLVRLARLSLRYGLLGAARRMAALGAMLQPGMGMADEEALIGSLEDARQGRLDVVLARGRHQLSGNQLSERDRVALAERLVTLAVLAGQESVAIEIYLETGGIDVLARSPVLAVHVAFAYGQLGALAQMTEIQAALEANSQSIPGSAGLVQGARLSFLAFLGKIKDVEALLDKNVSYRRLSALRRDYWRAVAHARSGNSAVARTIWRSIVGAAELGKPTATDQRAIALAQRALEDEVHWAVPATHVSEAEALVEIINGRARAHSTVPRMRGLSSFLEDAPVSLAFIGLNALIYLAFQRALSQRAPWEEGWLLLRFGANFPALSLSSEPWRLITSMFLHGGPYHLHIGFNLYALYLLGRLSEQIYGSWRFGVIYATAGITGSVASALYGQGLLSIGASGAIFGLLGAILVALARLKGRVPERWRTHLVTNLIVVIVLQILIGWQIKVIDNAAHTGGLIGGLVMGWLLGPLIVPKFGEAFKTTKNPARREKWLIYASTRVLCFAFVVAGIASAVMVFRTTEAVGLSHLPKQRFQRAGLVVRAPTHWVHEERPGGLVLQDPLLPFSPTFALLAAEPLESDHPSLEELGRIEQQMIVEHLNRNPNMTSVDLESDAPKRITPGLIRSDISLALDGRPLYQLNYFKIDSDSSGRKRLLTIMVTIPTEKISSYDSLIDAVAASARVVDNP